MGFIHSALQRTEVLAPNTEQKNWKGIVIAILVIAVVFSLIVIAIFLISPKETNDEPNEPFTLQEIVDGVFNFRRFSAHWIPGRNAYLYRSIDDVILEYDVDGDINELVMSNSTFRELNTDVYYPSADHSYLLLAYEIEKVKDYTTKARYKIYNRLSNTPKIRLISFPYGESWENAKLDLVLWSPTGSSLSFVFERRLFVQTDPFSSHVEINERDHISRHVYRGIANSFYADQVLKSSVGHWWSTDGSFLCYLVIDESNVPLYKYPFYNVNKPHHRTIIVESPYPKAGMNGDGILPTAKLFIARLSNPTASHIQLKPPKEHSIAEGMDHYYVTHVAWADDLHLAVQWLNRLQNVSILVFCEAKTGHCTENLVETSPEGQGWIDPLPFIKFINNQHSFLTLLSKRDGSSGFWKHVALVSLSMLNSNTRTFITEGLWDVTDIVGYDPSVERVFFIATNGDPRTRHLFRVSMPTSDGRLGTPVCMSCDLGESCQYVSASFSETGRCYIRHCLGPDVPTSVLKCVDDDREKIVEDNADLRIKLSEKAFPRKEYYEVENDNGEKMWVQVLLPRVLKKEQIYVYPMISLINAWPESQRVTTKFEVDLATYLASAEDVVVVMADARGTSGRGDRWRHTIYKRIGDVDLKDQIAAAQFVRNTLPYVDKDRMAVWGEDYGGYLTLRLLGHESNVFRCSVALSPITNWRYYYTFTSEKLFGSTKNFKVYDDAQIVIKSSEEFRGKHLLFVHGTADENVHFQHTAHVIKSLTEFDVDFNVQIYPDEDHSLDGVRRHVYLSSMKFLKAYCWNGGKPRQLGKISAAEDLGD